MPTRCSINGRTVDMKADPATPLLWTLRDELGLTGAKFGCGAALCGACTVHVDGQPVRAFITPTAFAAGKRVITIEGAGKDRIGRALQAAWIALEVPQCGYCQCGQIMKVRLRSSTEGDVESLGVKTRSGGCSESLEVTHAQAGLAASVHKRTVLDAVTQARASRVEEYVLCSGDSAQSVRNPTLGRRTATPRQPSSLNVPSTW